MSKVTDDAKEAFSIILGAFLLFTLFIIKLSNPFTRIDVRKLKEGHLIGHFN